MNMRGFTARVTTTKEGTILKQYHAAFIWQCSREAMFLKLLNNYSRYPKLLREGKDFIEISYCGERIKNLAQYADQKHDILEPLKIQKIKHRDINPKNLLVRNDKLYLIDFGYSIFDYEKDTPIPADARLGGIFYPGKPDMWDDSFAFDLTMRS